MCIHTSVVFMHIFSIGSTVLKIVYMVKLINFVVAGSIGDILFSAYKII